MDLKIIIKGERESRMEKTEWRKWSGGGARGQEIMGEKSWKGETDRKEEEKLQCSHILFPGAGQSPRNPSLQILICSPNHTPTSGPNSELPF